MPDFKSTEVDNERINSTSTGIDDEIEELLSIYTTIDGGIMPNLVPYWQGEAEQIFEKQFASFALRFHSLVTGYQTLNEQLKQAGTAYGKADDSVKQLIAKLPK